MRAQRVMIAVFALSISSLTLVGCEDQQARQRAKLQQAVEDATVDLRSATLVAVDPDNAEEFQNTRAKLTSVVKTLKSAPADGTTGQEGSVNLLLADAHRHLASMKLAEIGHMQQSIRDTHATIRTQASALQRLNAFVTAVGSIDTSDESGELESAATSASAQLQQISEELAGLDQPIAQLTLQNQEDAARVRELRREAQDLLRRASELGPAQGFAQYEQAVDKQRRANQIESEVAQRELNLAYGYEPQQKTAGSQAQNLQEIINALEQARQNLNEITSTISSEVSKTRDRIASLRSAVQEKLSEARTTLNEDFETAYQEGVQSADEALRAVQKAKRNLSSDDRDTAALLETQILEMKGRLHWAKARLLEDRASLLERMTDAGDALGDTSMYESALNEAREAYNQAIELAREAFTNAQAAMPGGSTQQLSAMRRSLEMATGSLQGRSMDEMESSLPANTAGDANSGGTTPSGYDSPQALLSALETIDPMRPETSVVMIDAIEADTPMEMRFVEALREMNRSAARMNQAIREQLGQDVLEALAQMGAAATPDFSTATLVDQADDSATVEVQTMQPGVTQNLELIRTGSGWKISFESAQRDAATPGMSVSDSTQLLQSMAAQFDNLAEQIEGGEITSQQELMTAMQALMTGGGQSP